MFADKDASHASSSPEHGYRGEVDHEAPSEQHSNRVQDDAGGEEVLLVDHLEDEITAKKADTDHREDGEADKGPHRGERDVDQGGVLPSWGMTGSEDGHDEGSQDVTADLAEVPVGELGLVDSYVGAVGVVDVQQVAPGGAAGYGSQGEGCGRYERYQAGVCQKHNDNLDNLDY